MFGCCPGKKVWMTRVRLPQRGQGCSGAFGSSGEGLFSKLARSVLRHIRVASKRELKDRIMAAMDRRHAWSYKLDNAG
jgi:hypothetical protein